MALTNQEQNFVNEIIAVSRDMLSYQKQIQQLIAKWNQNSFSNIDDADLQENSSLAHLDIQKVTDALTALTAIDTALGNYSSGQAVNLIKIIG